MEKCYSSWGICVLDASPYFFRFLSNEFQGRSPPPLWEKGKYLQRPQLHTNFIYFLHNEF